MTFPSDKPKVLITGVRGFTGIHLARALRDRGYEVYGLVRGTPLSSSEFQVNITDVAELPKLLLKIQPDFIIHLAAIASVDHNNIDDFYRTNLLGTLNLLKAAQTAKLQPRKIIIASSANVYGNPKYDPIGETACPSPINHYSNSKVAMENMVKVWFEEFPIVITRPFNYTGPGQLTQFLIPKIVDHFRQRKDYIELGNTDVVRDISDIQFVIEAYIRLLEHSVHSEIFNICSNKGYSIPDILGYLRDIAGYEIRVETAAHLMRQNEIKKLIGSNEKLFSVVGKILTPSLSETLGRMYLEG